METKSPQCPKCNSQNLRKNGKRAGLQCYLCKDCNHQFVPDKPPVVYEYVDSNAARLKFHKKTYREVYLKIRRDTYEDLVARMEAYSEANPTTGALQKKIYEILDEHFPKR